jgi:lysophospholipase L1-like esterase
VRGRGALVVLAVAMSAAACTGAGADRSVDAGTSPGAPRPVTYAAVGASETAGIGTEDPVEDAWPKVLWRTLPAGSVLYDFGVPGSTARQALREQVGSAIEVGADIATVWLNVNDLLHGVPPERFGRQLDAVVHGLSRDGRTMVLVANTPRLNTLPVYLACRSTVGRYVTPAGVVVACPSDETIQTPPPTAVRAAVAAYNEEIDRVVREEGAVLVDLHALGDVPNEHPEYVSEDGFHPSTEGAATIADLFEVALEAGGR